MEEIIKEVDKTILTLCKAIQTQNVNSEAVQALAALLDARTRLAEWW